ncbi:hypothetical protein HIM_08287 [Hirsutella minnesotensis 3608]|uniref:Uncharacterized protein n=1 Tax=Hirsutella minnesotensis 3608 TaxID=1043627 RepID=A0A0F7ZHB7_9HYPO|nr:hypothetical protein HIM_08287 [Hirsutella minnesotensis 3608]
MTNLGNVTTPVAVIGLSCRLPGNCNSPEQFWRFLLDGGIADTVPPSSRFNLSGHYDGTLRPWTMRTPGGMFINVDPRDVDAGFFGLSQVDAISMDPQQRQLLEVVYEGLENAGLTLEGIKSTLFGCFVASYASDYSDMQARDPEDRTPSFTVGSGRAMLSNRISHFLDIKGPRISDADGAIVAGCNLYMSPEHNMDQHAMTSAASVSGRCWTFDARADGYIKAEAVNCLILKRLDDAERHGDPIRAVIRGTSTNSDGWTPGIASPSPDAQALAIRRAYARAGISAFNDTAYLECHGTGTLAGDPIECRAVYSVFAASRPPQSPLRIGSVKSNIGHSEPAAGISGMLKTILAVERGIIPGNPTFEIPNPKIDFQAYKLLASKAAAPWPRGALRRASVNSFGYGGSNIHALVEHPTILLPGYESTSVTSYAADSDDMFADDDVDKARRLLVFSANDDASLKAYVKECIRHLSNPAVKVQSADLAYTLAQRRTRHFFRAYAVSDGPVFKKSQVVHGKPASSPRIGFVFTGQGAQWPQMGRELIRKFHVARHTIEHLDRTLQSMTDAPPWSLASELSEPRSPEHLRLPEFSQPLVIALQLALLAVLKEWGLEPAMVVGHSSGEIAAAVAARCLSPEDGIKIAYLRGKAAKDMKTSKRAALGMLAVGLGTQDSQPYLNSFPGIKIACKNSPKSVTLAGQVQDLEGIRDAVKADGHFARLVMVDLAYHSEYMKDIGEHYRDLLERHCSGLQSERQSHEIQFFSTVQGGLLKGGTGVEYWLSNMLSPVLFAQGVAAMIEEGGAEYLIELGPSGALAGPINQIIQELDPGSPSVHYSTALDRSNHSTLPLYDLAGKMFVSGVNIDLLKVNGLDAGAPKPRIIIDLPNYQWNHSVKYWHESLASKDWRYRQFPVHDLLGTKILGTSWNAPSWRRTLRLKDVPWIRHHTIGADIVFPASGYIAMAVEAMFQTAKASGMELVSDIDIVSRASYRLRDVRFLRALVVVEDAQHQLYLFFNPAQGQKDTWFHFKISSLRDDAWTEHCSGFVRIGPATSAPAGSCTLEPLRYPAPAKLWYKSMQNAGFNFGQVFQNLTEIESVAGQRTSRARINFPGSLAQTIQSKYALHPVVLDAFFQSTIPSLYQGHRTLIQQALVPRLIDEILITSSVEAPINALAVTNSTFTTGRPDKVQNYTSNSTVYEEYSGCILAKVDGLHYAELSVPEARKSSHTLARVSWKADISLLHEKTDLDSLAASDSEALVLSGGLCLPRAAACLVSLLKHKVAVAAVLDLDMTVDQPEVPTQADETALKYHLAPFRRYLSAFSTLERMVEAQKRLPNVPCMEFHIYDPASSGKPPFDADAKFDLVVLRMPPAESSKLEAAYRTARELCTSQGFVVLVQQSSLSNETDSSSEAGTITASRGTAELGSLLRSAELGVRVKNSSFEASVGGTISTVYLCAPLESQRETANAFQIVDLSGGASTECSALIHSLANLDWTGSPMGLPTAADQPPHALLLLLDDPQSPLLAHITETDWNHLRSLLKAGRRLLWLTSGSQLAVSSPSNALIHGFARSLRNEEPTLSLATLDLSSFSHIAAAESTIGVVAALASCKDTDDSRFPTESEYCERDGVLYVSRVVPDQTVVKAAMEAKKGAELKETWLRKNPKTVRMYCERIGAMDSIHFNELPDQPTALGDGEVEDIATSLGIVPENEHLLGLEGAGVIRKVGSKVDSYRVGERVLVHGKGSFANRNRVPKENVFLLPEWLSFEEAATMSIVYFTAVFSLMETAHVKKGQSVLIHSAAGGIGDSKRHFLTEQHGIAPERIFSSRTTGFGAKIRALTKGRGIDVVLNSLTGDLLNESWRLLADNGTLLEIGKKDIVDRNTLSMEPFDRNCSYRGIDISRPSILDDLPLIGRVLQKVRQLLVAGHIKPISPMKVFPFSQIPDAMRYMRSGEHMGKIVISVGDVDDVKVATRPAPQVLTLDPRAAYLIIGGLKGLCGSLATYMARCGARNLIIMSRSGADDERSRRVVQDLESLGATVKTVKGDVSSLQDTTRIFRESAWPIKGIIQGAMLLRDKTFELMTAQEFHDALASKLAGTWNLHTAAAEQTLGHKLDFFTMLSSISGVVGTAGQANYAAGSSFQDAFARYRHSLGLAAHTVDLGIVEDVGYMSEHQALTGRVLSRSRLSVINEEQLHEILLFSILQQTAGLSVESASQMVTGLPFPLPEDSPILADKRFHSLLMPRQSRQAHVGSGDEESNSIQAFRAMLKASVAVEKAVSEAVKIVRRQVVRVLGLAADIEASKPLSSYGIDSLAAVDLRNWLRVRLGVELTTLDVLNAASLEVLCAKVVDRSRAE